MAELWDKIMMFLHIEFVAYFVAAMIIGWVASLVMNDRPNIIRNMFLSIVGAYVAGKYISPLVGVGTINDGLTLETCFVTLIGSIVVIVAFNAIFGRRRG